MSTFSIFLVLIVIVAFLLIVVIMVQNPKGGGLSSSFGGGGSQQVGGVKQTSDFLDKSTWALATLLLILILLSNVTIINNRGVQDSKLLDGNQAPIENTQSNNLPPVDQQ
ncbi:preprotein translocase subunit SecG [Psychroflexus gondwanensis]|jgi:preprotein translocase subunit SecG|uniref:Protein-export membrane protein SecG n=1 Tax=Psychroflexus gondwanensis ACAM 44 TaxID=1189619 RepID=N1WJF0_9FLAO|nr:preprotein translocase subunit SecG [Psychroflexus gondwanensis]EMY80371.1 protein-export membrane protein SecG [Psychroflexus gondwanensis ACAM 44]TXE20596.1 preprotein translocase subunit SecG [Psychroflexus gondwanensis]